MKKKLAQQKPIWISKKETSEYESQINFTKLHIILNGLLKIYKARYTSLIMVNTIEVLISKALINSDISYDEFVSLNNVLWYENIMT